MEYSNRYIVMILLVIVCSVFMFSRVCPAWVGVEFNGKLTGIADPYEAPGVGGDGGILELSGRFMYQESLGVLDAEVHWLANLSETFGEQRIKDAPDGQPFRIFDLKNAHHEGERSLLSSEVDRLSLTWNLNALRVTAGRQAVTWGEAFYYNVGDLFGAFPITETNRLHKPGIDGLYVTAGIGSFSDASILYVPSDEDEDSTALQALFPAGPGSLSLTGGTVLGDDQTGAGYSLDIEGTKLYGTCLLTAPDDGEDYTELVLGMERQVGPYTHVVGEVYRNGWGAEDADEYAALLVSERFLSGRALTLGRWNAAVQISRQMTPLLTVTPALFANLSDGSILVRMDGALSVSDLTSVTGGMFLGIGERPDGLLPGSEFGAVPVSVYVEVVHSL
jgi:hypothetical protein